MNEFVNTVIRIVLVIKLVFVELTRGVMNGSDTHTTTK